MVLGLPDILGKQKDKYWGLRTREAPACPAPAYRQAGSVVTGAGGQGQRQVIFCTNDRYAISCFRTNLRFFLSSASRIPHLKRHAFLWMPPPQLIFVVKCKM
jgi:hypothetical protein